LTDLRRYNIVFIVFHHNTVSFEVFSTTYAAAYFALNLIAPVFVILLLNYSFYQLSFGKMSLIQCHI